jgi:hypothetical protein
VVLQDEGFDVPTTHTKKKHHKSSQTKQTKRKPRRMKVKANLLIPGNAFQVKLPRLETERSSAIFLCFFSYLLKLKRIIRHPRM